MADFNTTISVMVYESGALIGSLPSHSQGQQLADKIEHMAEQAITASQPRFDLSLSPIEIGMAFASITANESALGQALGQKIGQALGAKLQELGISLNNQGTGGSVGSDAGSEPVGDEPAGDAAPTEDAPDTQPEEQQSDEDVTDEP